MNVMLVGFGRIGRTHRRVLHSIDGLAIALVVDPVRPAGDEHDGPWVGALEQASFEDVDAVILAVPTASHAAVYADLRQHWDGEVLVEKPAATDPTAVDALVGDEKLRPIYHAAHAPEVEWLVGLWPGVVDRWGAPVGIDAAFCDPYDATDAAAEALGDSWLDSGINALSVLQRLVSVEAAELGEVLDGRRRRAFRRFRCDLDGSGCTASIFTSWDVFEASKHTRITFERPGTWAVLDHQAGSGRVVEEGHLVDEFFPTPPERRLDHHYRRCFELLLLEGNRTFEPAVDRRLHHLLLG